MDARSKVVKSKSSNYALAPKTEKKCTSNSDFTRNLVKKRGMYVKRRDSLSPVYPREGNIHRKPPPRPKPDQKKFLASVLSILSKSTTGTQYPENNEINKSKTKHKMKSEKRTFKSRILNTNIYKDDEQFVILQTKKDVAQTPSIFSNTSTVADRPKIRSIRDVLNNNSDIEVENKLKKIRTNDEPETLVKNIDNDKDRKLYNIFVDILQSTFNNYNTKEDELLSEPRVAFEIDESVAKKLMVKPQMDIKSEYITKNIPTNELKAYNNEAIDIKLSNHKFIKPKLITKSFIHTKKNIINKTYSFPDKKIKKNSKKENLLNLLKEELQQQTYEEPQNLYHTLKVMAKNKKYEKSLSNIHKISSDNDECMYKREEIIKLRANKKVSKVNKKRSIVKKYSEVNRPKAKKVSVESNHSLEVIELNYEEPYKRIVYKNEERIVNSSSESETESNFDYYTLLKFQDSSACDFY